MIGKGSMEHNRRSFIAENVKAEKTANNITYKDEPIKKVYEEMFGTALQQHNEKQKRSDRKIENYYEHFRTSKQEKLFHEVIFQVGKAKDCAVDSEEGEIAKKILDSFVKDFEKRNPRLRVFSAHLHMDEATPHLHIDFIPFTTDSKRGLETRVSLKKALEHQGFKGGSRSETEMIQWIESEKKQLAEVMKEHGVQWKQLGTKTKHLSVLDFKKQERQKEIKQLGKTIMKKREEVLFLTEHKVSAKNELDDFLSELEKTRDKLKTFKKKEKFIAKNARHYDDDPAYELAAPKSLMSAKTYYEKFAAPLTQKLKNVIRSILIQFFEEVNDLKLALSRANERVWNLTDIIKKLEPENERLRVLEKDYSRIRKFLGFERIDEIIGDLKAQEIVKKHEGQHKVKPKDYER